MTREERINSALLPILEKMREHGATDEMCKMYDNGFHVGAMWADQHPHWISVNDELPPIGAILLVAIPFGGELNVLALSIKDESDFECLSGMTHWMPLPQPPKGDAK